MLSFFLVIVEIIIFILNRNNGQFFHDFLCGTYVIYNEQYPESITTPKKLILVSLSIGLILFSFLYSFVFYRLSDIKAKANQISKIEIVNITAGSGYRYNKHMDGKYLDVHLEAVAKEKINNKGIDKWYYKIAENIVELYRSYEGINNGQFNITLYQKYCDIGIAIMWKKRYSKSLYFSEWESRLQEEEIKNK